MRATVPLQDLLYFVRDPWPWGKPHEAAGIHRTSRQRCNRLAARGAGAARPDTADRSADGVCRERSGRTDPRHRIPGGATEARVEYPDRHSLGRWRHGGDATTREGTRRLTARPDSFGNHPHHRRAARTDPHHPKAAALSFGVEAIAAPVHNSSDIESILAAQVREPNGGLIVVPDTFLVAHREAITSLAARHRLPAVYPFRMFTDAGGLLSYGNDVIDNYRRTASYVDRILKGEKPSELPVQIPVKFELVINLKTAKALGLEVPLFLQQRADEVIE